MRCSSFRQFVICGLLVAGISVVQAEPGPHAPFDAKGRVIKNHDGDTITLATNDHGVLTIRLSGADAPETGQGYWKVARDYLRSLVRGAETSACCYKRDRYDRAVCHVRVGAQDIQEALIAKGYAWYAFQFAHELDADQRARYQEAEQRARDQRTGLWREPDPMPPWECRQHKRAGNSTRCR